MWMCDFTLKYSSTSETKRNGDRVAVYRSQIRMESVKQMLTFSEFLFIRNTNFVSQIKCSWEVLPESRN